MIREAFLPPTQDDLAAMSYSKLKARCEASRKQANRALAGSGTFLVASLVALATTRNLKISSALLGLTVLSSIYETVKNTQRKRYQNEIDHRTRNGLVSPAPRPGES